MAKEDIVVSLGFDLSSVPSTIATLKSTLKNQKLIANIAFQSGKLQGEVRNEIKGALKELEKLKTPAIDDRSLPRIRYALYDISSTAKNAGDALIGFGTSAVKAAADYESSFTAVERTTMTSIQMLDSLRSQLSNLTREIPMAFKDVTEIASLGAQLGVASGDLAGFAETVAKFSATTNVSTQTAAQSFGALGELLDVSAAQYENLGSAVAQVGVNSVATEAEILSVSTQIAGVANSAGLSAQYVIGLSGALASLRIPAEQSRGALTRVFQEINRAAADGEVGLQGFASVMGITAKQATELAGSDMEKFFTMFISGLSKLDNTSLTQTLDDLQLNELRVTNTLTRLSRNTGLMAQTMGDATQAYKDGTFLTAAYALKVEDLATKFTILQNSVQELVATFGSSLLPIVGPIIDTLSNVIQSITDAMSTGSGKWFSGIATSGAIVIGSLLAVVSAVAFLTASLFALQTAIKGLGWTAAMGGMKGLAASLWGAGAASAGATAGVRTLGLALKALPIIAIVGALASMVVAMTEASNSSEISFKNLIGDTTGLSDALQKDTDAYNKLDAAGKAAAASTTAQVAYAATSISSKYGEAAQRVGYTAEVLGKKVPESAYAASSAIEYNTRIIGANTQAWLKNQLMQNESFQKLAGNADFANFVKKTGYDVGEAFRLQADQGGEAARNYYFTIAREALLANKITIQEIAKADANIAAQLMADNAVIASSPATGGMEWVLQFQANMFAALDWYLTNMVWYGQWIKDAVKNVFGVDISNAGKQASQAIEGAASKASILDITNKNATDSTKGLSDQLDGLGKSAGGAAKKIYLLTDYANDLSSIWSRAFDIRFSGQSTLDAITKSFRDIAKATADANEEIATLNADIAQLTADQQLQEYFLSVATAYGDALSASQINANLAKIKSDLTAKNKSLAAAQDKTNKTLIGNSDAAIANRADVLDLVKSYQEHVKALAASGMREDQLRATTEQLRQDFIAQATQLGYNVDELGVYAVAFDDVKRSIDAVPRDVTVDFYGDAALTAIEEWAVKAKEQINGVNGTTISPKVDDAEVKKAARLQVLYGEIAQLIRWSAEAYDGGEQAMILQQAQNIRDRIQSGNYADGGYTGAGGKYDVAGIVHRGEYVVPKDQVNQLTGLPYYMSQPRAFFNGGSTGQSQATIVSLSPEDRAILRSAGGSGEVVLYANNVELARSVNDGNRTIVAQGGRP